MKQDEESSGVLGSIGFALGFEAMLVLVFFLFPWFPESGGGDSQVGHAILMLHYPFMWILASVLRVNFVAEVLLSVILAVVSWSIIFYGLWRFLPKRGANQCART